MAFWKSSISERFMLQCRAVVITVKLRKELLFEACLQFELHALGIIRIIFRQAATLN